MNLDKNSGKSYNGISQKSNQLLVFFSKFRKGFCKENIGNYGSRKCCYENQFKLREAAVRSIVFIALDNTLTLLFIHIDFYIAV